MVERRSELIGTGACFALASAAVLLTRLDGGIALLWVANAVGLNLICGLAPRTWARPVIGFVLANAAATLLFGPVKAAAPGFALANAGEFVLAAALLRRAGLGCDVFETTRSVLRFVLLAAIAAPMASGLFGATVGMLAFGKPWAATWLDWSIGHALGMLIAMPLVRLVAAGEFARWLRRTSWPQLGRAALLLCGVALVSLGVFAQERLPLLFVTLLPLLVATFQLGQIGAALSLLLVAAIGGALTAAGHGPVTMIHGSAALRLQFFQLYLASAFLISLPVAGALRHRERLMAAVRAGEARYRMLAETSSDLIVEIGPDGIVRYASPAAREMLGVEPEELVGRRIDEFIHPHDAPYVEAQHRRALTTPGLPVTIEFPVHKANGESGWFESHTRAIETGHGAPDGVVSVLREVSERKALERDLRKAAETDPLTGLANRRAFMDRLDAAFARSAGRAVSVAVLDIDFFKRVNDTHGHAAGDTALLIVADICRVAVRAADLVARIGGEEFALLLEGAAVADAAMIGERLRETLAAAPIPLDDDAHMLVTISIGVAERAGDENAAALLARADRALYRAKETGRNRLVVDPA